MGSALAYTLEGSRPRELLQEDVNVIATMEVEEEEEESQSARQMKVRLRLRGVAVEAEAPLTIALPASKPKKIARRARAAQKTAASASPLKEVLLDYNTLWHKRWGGLDDDDAAVTSATAAVLQERFFNDWINGSQGSRVRE